MFREFAVEHLAHRLTADLHQINRLPVDGLEGVFQFGAQIQVIHQRFQPLPLPTDHPSMLLGLWRERVIVLQFAGMAQHHFRHHGQAFLMTRAEAAVFLS